MNKTRKEFMSGLTDGDKVSYNFIFGKVEPIENELGKEISDFDFSEMEKLFYSFDSKSVLSLQNLFSQGYSSR